MDGLRKFMAAFQFSRKIVTDGDILNPEVTTLAKFIAKT